MDFAMPGITARRLLLRQEHKGQSGTPHEGHLMVWQDGKLYAREYSTPSLNALVIKHPFGEPKSLFFFPDERN